MFSNVASEWNWREMMVVCGSPAIGERPASVGPSVCSDDE
jgi:hypothetical protein